MMRNKIWITSAWYPTATSTAGIFVKEQAEALQRAGHEVHVLIITYNTVGQGIKARFKKPDRKFDVSGTVQVHHFHVQVLRSLSHSRNPQQLLKEIILKDMARQARKLSAVVGIPDIMHHHCLSDNAYVAEHLATQWNIPYVFTEHSNYRTDSELNKFNVFETYEDRKRFVQGAAARIGVSENRAKSYSECYGAPFEVIGNLVSDVFRVEPIRAEKEASFTFCAVGILEQRKRYDLLIRAFSKSFRGAAVQLLIAGSGTKKQELEELCRSLQIQEQLRFLGKLNRLQLIELFDRSHCHVLASDEETFGIVHAEAMFRGLPIISTICGGPEEIITPESGLLVTKGDLVELASKMNEMREHYSRYNSEQIRQSAIDRFAETEVVVQLQRVYQKALSQHPRNHEAIY
jgi:glycosyltransferase involved in cell wall biosynthesis